MNAGGDDGLAERLGLPAADLAAIVALLAAEPAVQRAVVFGSRALGRQQRGSDLDLCLEAPDLGLQDLLRLGASLDDLLLPWSIDLQLRHLISHPPLLAHIDRAGVPLPLHDPLQRC